MEESRVKDEDQTPNPSEMDAATTYVIKKSIKQSITYNCAQAHA